MSDSNIALVFVCAGDGAALCSVALSVALWRAALWYVREDKGKIRSAKKAFSVPYTRYVKDAMNKGKAPSQDGALVLLVTSW